MNMWIDKISFHANYYLDMTDLANAREIDLAVPHIGLGQDQMAYSRDTRHQSL